jgi:predicted nucleic acid-binding protein
MASAVYLVDTNVLLRWVKPDDRDFQLTSRVIDKILREGGVLCYTSQNVAEFWNTCTRPLDRNGFRLTPSEADKRAQHFEHRLRLLFDGPPVHAEWRRLLVSERTSGAQVHDARLVAFMRVHGIDSILTFDDRDFNRYSGIRALNPKMLTPQP